MVHPVPFVVCDKTRREEADDGGARTGAFYWPRLQVSEDTVLLLFHRLKRLDSSFVPRDETDDVTLDVADGG